MQLEEAIVEKLRAAHEALLPVGDAINATLEDSMQDRTDRAERRVLKVLDALRDLLEHQN